MKKLIFFLVVLILIAGFIYFSPYFEREKPEIIIKSNNYWNGKIPIEITLKDNTGIRYYKIDFGNYHFSKQLEKPEKVIKINFLPPRNFTFTKEKYRLKIKAIDKSFWNFLQGNTSLKEISLIIDRKKPIVNIISHSYGIGRGGSALIIYQAVDKNLYKNYIVVNNHIFKVFPFVKDGYYISLIVWPVKEKDFSCFIYTEDRAGNIVKRFVKFYLKKYSYKTSKITLTDTFLNGKVKEILEDVGWKIPQDPVERFKLMNEKLRQENESLISKISKDFKIRKITTFNIKPFHPLKNGAKRASFGDHRFYYYKGKLISESWHLGIDLASVKHAPIILSNDGVVKYTDFTGIYGNVIIIYHGLGLYSLYAHCQTFFVKPEEKVKAKKIIGRTDSTGAVFGDHLHFGILIQGFPAYPIEWFDAHWIKDNIEKVIKDAELMIK